MIPEPIRTDLATGSTVAGLVILGEVLQEISLVAGCVATICAAILGVAGVIRLFRHRNKQ